MVLCRAGRIKRPDLSRLPFLLNGSLIVLGVFILLAMSVVWGIFEEFTAFTDYTQQWIEFNFFIHYWDKLTITRVYLAFIYIYGAVILAIPSFQIHGLRKRNLNLLYFAPMALIFVAVISMLGALCWLITTAVNYNEGFLATGGFIFERMRFKGNVWKDLKFREQSFAVVTENILPRKAPILRTWINQRQRDFECCGWNSFLDYSVGNYSTLPESCCKRKYRMFQCGDDYLNPDKEYMFNTRGCGPVMYSWYRSGFTQNIIMAVIGLLISAYQIYTYTVNRKEYFNLLYELDEMQKPMISNTISMSTINSKTSSVAYGASGGRPGSIRSSKLPQISLNQSKDYAYNNFGRSQSRSSPIYEQASFTRK